MAVSYSQISKPPGYAIQIAKERKTISYNLNAEYGAGQNQVVKEQDHMESMKEIEEKFRALSEHNKSFLFHCDKEGSITYCSPGVERSIGFTRDELMGTHFERFCLHDEFPKMTAAFKEILAGTREKSVELNLSCKDGSLLPVEVGFSQITKSGRIVGIQGITRNIGDRKRLEEEIVETEKKHRNLLNKLPVAVSLTSIDGEVLFINEFAVKTLGYESPEEAMSEGVLTLYKDPNEREITLGIVMKEGMLENYPLDFLSPSGETIHALVSASLEEGVISGIIVDVTELKHTEKKLRRSQDQLRLLASHLQSIREEERKNISREIHDELGQSLTALNIDLTWLGNQLAEDHRSLLNKISSMSKRIDNNIQTLKEIATELRPKVLDDLGLTAAIEWQSKRFQERTGIPCEVTLDPENIVLEQDLSTNIFRIFQETLTNVTRHANATRVKVHLVEEADRMVLEVVDDGRGIRKEEITSPHAIGLLGMRERVYPWNGEVTFRGKRGKGTTVTITVPRERLENRP